LSEVLSKRMGLAETKTIFPDFEMKNPPGIV